MTRVEMMMTYGVELELVAHCLDDVDELLEEVLVDRDLHIQIARRLNSVDK